MRLADIELVAVRDQLNRDGYVVIPNLGTLDRAVAVLHPFGEFMPQYDGQLTHAVKAIAGFENVQYSKSQNTIRVHTEAPGWDPPPHYLALFCHAQATCGGGHTDLMDGTNCLSQLPSDLVAWLRKTPIAFPGRKPADPRQERPVIRKPLVETRADGPDLLRFSYNLLTFGDYDPPVSANIDPQTLPLGELGRELAAHVAECFARDKEAILIPEGGLLIWDNQRMFHARSAYRDPRRHLTRFWLS